MTSSTILRWVHCAVVGMLTLGIGSHASPARATSLKAIHNFPFDGNGATPQSGLVEGPDGALYGTTVQGGIDACGTIFGVTGCGTVYRLTDPGGGQPWIKTVLHRFRGNGLGAFPFAGLIIDSNGALYGATTQDDGGGGFGMVFKLEPPTSGTVWTMTMLYRFRGGTVDGDGPFGPLYMDAGGSLFGTTRQGGGDGCLFNAGCGIIFRLDPPPSGQTRWVRTILHRFNDTDGSLPYAGLIAGPDGSLFGTASSGGTGTLCSDGCGTVFKLRKLNTRGSLTGWSFSVIANFTGDGVDGTSPTGNLVVDDDGVLYGTALFGGAGDSGAVFQLAPPGAGQTEWTKQTLHSFKGCSDGAFPYAGLFRKPSGTLYGTTSEGGCADGGTIFKLAPAGGGAWTRTILRPFFGDKGAFPYSTLIEAHGGLIGTASEAGLRFGGTVFLLIE